MHFGVYAGMFRALRLARNLDNHVRSYCYGALAAASCRAEGSASLDLKPKQNLKVASSLKHLDLGL